MNRTRLAPVGTGPGMVLTRATHAARDAAELGALSDVTTARAAQARYLTRDDTGPSGGGIPARPSR